MDGKWTFLILAEDVLIHSDAETPEVVEGDNFVCLRA